MSPQYARDLRNSYNGESKPDKQKLIRDTIDKSNSLVRKKNPVKLGETSIRALYRLHKKYGPNSWISLNQMDNQSGITLGKSPSRGLYIWDNELGNGVVEKKKGHTEYCIVQEFYLPVEQVLKERRLQ